MTPKFKILDKYSVRILHECSHPNSTKEKIARKFHRLGKDKRAKIIANLIQDGLLMELVAIRDKSGPPPTVYKLSEKGKQYLEEYKQLLQAE